MIYNTIVKSIVAYRNEGCQLKDRPEKTPCPIDINIWRRSEGRSRRDSITNTRIWEIMGVPYDMVDEIKTKQLR